MTLAETPGSYYALAYWLAAVVVILVEPHRFNWTRTTCIAAIGLLLLEGWCLLTNDIPDILFIPCVLVIILLVFAIMVITCRLKIKQIGYRCVHVVMLGEFAASLEYQIYYYALQSGFLPDTWWSNALCLVVIHSLVFSIIFLVCRRIIIDDESLPIGWHELGTAICIGIFAYALSNISYVLTDTPFSASLSSELFAIRTLTDFGGLAVLVVYDSQLRARRLSSEEAALRSMLRMYYSTYRFSKESMDAVNRKYHDLKHQISMLRSISTENDDRNRYLDRLEQQISGFESQIHTGNDVFDTLVNTKSLQYREQGVTLTVMVQGEALEFFDLIDLWSLFGNALDNAIEAVLKIPDTNSRIIRLAVARAKGFVRIDIENRFMGDVVIDRGVPRSTKNDPVNHGYGFASMQEIVHRYGGTIRTDAADGWFGLHILIPVR